MMNNAISTNVNSNSQTPQQKLLENLRQLMPEAFSEGKLDIEKLKQLVSDEKENNFAPSFEAYGLNWAGKHEVYRELKTPTSETLLPQPKDSVNFDTTQNLFIEGDNLAVLKILQKSYYNRIKMIYIDPPYNTGNDRFIYPDDYSESLSEYQARTGQKDDEGNLTYSDGMRKNSKENGQYHSNWLNMMYPRLALAKNLLREDGVMVIFVSIDDNEVANLRLLMDEIFGEDNFVAEFTVASNSSKNNSKYVSINHEYLVCFAKNLALTVDSWKVPKNQVKAYEAKANQLLKKGLSEEDIHNELLELVKYPRFYDFDHYTYADENGVYQLDNFGGVVNGNFDTEIIHPITKKPCAKPTGGWRNKDKKIKEMLSNNQIVFGKDETVIPRIKRYLHDYLEQVPKSTLFFDSQSTTKWLKSEKLPFDFPKAIEYIKHILSMLPDSKNDIILDFFAGSSTTAHAVMALNAEDGGNRRFIMVQLPEATEKGSESAKAGYANIAEISKERIRRAGKQILSDNPELADNKELDLGFKSYRLSDSNFIPWRQPDSYDADSLLVQLEKQVNPIADNATTEGLITELMLKEGYALTATIEQADGYYLITQDQQLIDDKSDDSLSNKPMTLVIVLAEMSRDKANTIIQLAPSKTIIMDHAFSDDANKANIVLQFEDAGLVVGCV